MRENIAKNLCKVIALANQKGGVAKSFTTASLAVGLVNSGNRVLVIDNDPQGHASRCLGVRKPEKTIYDIMEKLVKGEEITPNDCMECIVTTDEGVDLLPANVKYAMMELEMSSANGKDYPYELVKSQFLKLKKEHVEYVANSMKTNLGEVKNIRSYLITALYNAPSTYCNYVAQAYRTVNQTEYESEYDVENKREMEYMKSLRESDPEGYKVYIAGKIEKRKAEGKWIV
ncbi:MAG: AAA family ATPase [Lachnospiraceae bacterium]|nr:AAA family ATPase [Lachnospiraceae bacterium]